jgi:hypothetical protein
MCLVQLFITIKTLTWYHSHPLGYNENQRPTFFLKPKNHGTKDTTCGNIKETPTNMKNM